MEKIKEILRLLCSRPTVSGKEITEFKTINDISEGLFDIVESDNTGNIILARLCAKENAKKLLLDAHFDVIGLMVTKINEGGFLSVCPIGGIDGRILPSCEVTIHGKEDVYGVIVSTPPHLKSKDSSVPKVDSVLIDTGYEKNELEGLVAIGDTVTIRGDYTEIENDYVLSSFLDNRSCVASCIDAVSRVSREELEYDVYISVSAGEEIGRMSTRTVAFTLMPDIIITTDVNFAREPDIEARHSIECKKGPSVDISSTTDRALSRSILRIAKENNIPCQVIVEPGRTGTNHDALTITGTGARCAVMSLPLKSMHTTCESVNLRDVKALSNILSIIIKTKEADL